MIRLVLFAGLLAAAYDPSCGDVDSKSSGPNAPCTRDHDCRDGLVCGHGVCVDPNEPPSDGGADVIDGGPIVDAGGP